MLSRVPYAGFVMFFITGILSDAYLFPGTGIVFQTIAAILVLAVVISLWFYHQKSAGYNSLFFSVFLITAGALTHRLQTNQLQADLLSLSDTKYSSYQAIVKSLPEKRKKSIRLEVVVKGILNENSWNPVNLPALVSLPIDVALVPKPGDIIVVNGRLERAGLPLNPQEFDYRSYLWNKGIVWTDYLPEGTFQVLSGKALGGPAGWSMHLSEWADRMFRENIREDKSYGLVKAMLLGRRDDLRSDQVDDYTTSGTVHILSVSGMHVAIIFLVISASLGWIKRWEPGRWIYLVTVTALLCFYALVTGLPPSVQRATLMCVIFVIAEVFKRKQASINTLAISALLILIFDSQALFDVGFQLSYVAMTGIFLLYQPIALVWQPSNRILKYFWQITALSFAAQLATFPLSLYYFHQFPFYFWLVNPFVIVFTNLLLPAAMVLLLCSVIGVAWMQFLVNWVVDLSAYLTNISVAVPKLLPGYLIKNLYLDKAEVILLYGFIFLAWYAYFKMESKFLKYSFIIGVVFVIYSVSVSIQTYVSTAFTIHSVPKHSVISFKEGDRLYISSDSAFRADTDAYDFRIKNYAISSGILNLVYLSERSDYASGSVVSRSWNNGVLLSWNNKLISRGALVNTTLPIDYMLICSGNPNSKLSTNSKTIFLLSGEIRGRNLEKWKDYLAKSNFYDLTNGALSLN